MSNRSSKSPIEKSRQSGHLDCKNNHIREIVDKRERQKYQIIRNASLFLLCLIVPGLILFNCLILYLQEKSFSTIHAFFVINTFNLLCFSGLGHFTLSPPKMYRTFLIFVFGTLLYVFGVFILRDKSEIPCVMGAMAIVILAYFLSRRLFKLTTISAAIILSLGILVRGLHPWDLLKCHHTVCAFESFFVFTSILFFSLFLLLRKHDDSQEDLKTMVELNSYQGSIVNTLVDTTEILTGQLDSLNNVIDNLTVQSKLQLDSASSTNISLEQISQMTQNTARSAAAMLDISKQSRVLVENSKKNFQAIDAQAKQALSRAQDSQSLTESIAKAATQLDDINIYLQEIIASLGIMSINAAIQAAKAGHHGRGFQVVVKELASILKETKDKVGASQKILSTISSDSIKSAELSRQVATSMEQELQAIEEINSIFNRITGSFSQMVSLVEPIGDAIIRENHSIDEVFSQTKRQTSHSEDLENSVSRLHATLGLISEAKDRLSEIVRDSKN